MTHPAYFTDMPARQNPLKTGVRILSRTIWDILQRQWEQHRMNNNVPPPRLAPPSARKTYFTDAESLQVCSHATDFGLRLSLWQPDLVQIQIRGCVVVYFDVSLLNVQIPEPSQGGAVPTSAPILRKGLTTGGAREWIVNDNVALDDNMEAFVVENGGARWGPLVL